MIEPTDLRKDFDWENRRAGPMVELQWIEEQVERVESSDSIKSARQKLQEKSLADMRSRMDEEGASSSEE